MGSKSSNIYVVEQLEENVLKNHHRKSSCSSEKEYSFDEALNLIGFGKLHIIILLICGIILMAVLNETMGMMIIGIASQCDLNLTSGERGFLGAVSFIGIMVSSHLWGYVADTAGRRKLIMFTLFGSNVFSVASCFTNNFWIFVVLRLCAGICISGPSATLYAYLGEFNSSKYSSVAISWASIFVGVSTVYIPGIAWLILPQTWSFPIYGDFEFRPWRLLLILYTLPGFIGALCLLKLPESPKFLLSQKKDDEVMEIIRWLYKSNTGNPPENFIVKKLQREVNKDCADNLAAKKRCSDIFMSMWRQTVPLFKNPYLRNFFICCIVQFGVFFISGGMGLWYPEIQNRLNAMEGGEHLTVCEVIHMSTNVSIIDASNSSLFQSKICDDSVNTKVYVDSILLGSFYIVGYTFLGFTISFLGRQIILPAALILSGISGLALHWISHPLAIVIIFCCHIVFAGVCISVVNGAVVDIIPTYLRGMAVCISLMMGRLGSVVGSNIIGNLLEVNCDVTFYIFSGFVIMCGLLALLLPSDK